MSYENSGARDRHRYLVDGVVTKFVGKKKAEGQSVIGSEDAGNCSDGLEKGTLDISGKNRKSAGKANV
jgi:hypothetical protein